MAYAVLQQVTRKQVMNSPLPALPIETETIAELRELYRAAEARAARLRLLSSIGQALALAGPETMQDALQTCARSLAFFLGSNGATIERGGSGPGIPVHAPGGMAGPVAMLVVDSCPSLDAIADPEDRETARMCLELFGATIDRVAREQERASLVRALTEREHRLEMLVSRFFSAQEEERRRVSHELHDGVAQTATALVRLLEGSGQGTQQGLAPEERANLATIARDLLKELRAVIGGLRPTLLDDLGLAAALQALADGLENDGFEVAISLDPAAARLPPSVETALFRVAQESVTNIRKHAGAGCAVSIELELSEGRQRYLRICDAGAGLAQPVHDLSSPGDGNHVGIEVMQERMSAIGGTLEWVAGEHGGVTVTAILPAGVGQ